MNRIKQSINKRYVSFFVMAFFMCVLSLQGAHSAHAMSLPISKVFNDGEILSFYEESSVFEPFGDDQYDDGQYFGIYPMLSSQGALYLGIGTSAPAASDGAVIAKYTGGDSLTFISSLNEQGIMDLSAKDDETIIFGGTDPCCGDVADENGDMGKYSNGWDFGNYYSLDTTDDTLTKRRNVPNAIHGWGVWQDEENDYTYYASSAHYADTADIYSVSSAGFLMGTPDDGETWESIADGTGVGEYRTYDVAGAGGSLFVQVSDGAKCGISISQDGGQTWVQNNDYSIACSSRLMVVDDAVYALSTAESQFVRYGTDGEVTIFPYSGFTPSAYYPFIADQYDNYYASTGDGRVMLTRDFSTWQEIANVGDSTMSFTSISYWQEEEKIMLGNRGVDANLWEVTVVNSDRQGLPDIVQEEDPEEDESELPVTGTPGVVEIIEPYYYQRITPQDGVITYKWKESGDVASYNFKLYDRGLRKFVQDKRGLLKEEICEAGICSISLDQSLTASQLHSWYVSAVGANGKISSPIYAKFYALTTNYPQAPVTISPEQSDVVRHSDITYKWHDAADATEYDLSLYDRQKSVTVAQIKGVPKSELCDDDICEYTPEVALSSGRNHIWYLRAVNSSGRSSYNMTYFSVVAEALPASPHVIAPTQTILLNQGADVTFSWKLVNGATKYHLHSYDRASQKWSFTRNDMLAQDVCDGSVCSVTSDVSFGDARSHIWYLRSANDYGTSPYVMTHFDISTFGPPQAPNIVRPLEGSKVFNASPLRYVWESVPGAHSYNFSLYDKSARTTVQTKNDIDASTCVSGRCTFVSEIDLEDDGNYVWYVSTFDSLGNRSPQVYTTFQTLSSSPPDPPTWPFSNGEVSDE